MTRQHKLSRLAALAVVSLVVIMGSTLSGTYGDTPQPPAGLAAVNPATPMAAFTLPDAKGDTFNSSALQNKVVVVRFWATW